MLNGGIEIKKVISRQSKMIQNGKNLPYKSDRRAAVGWKGVMPWTITNLSHKRTLAAQNIKFIINLNSLRELFTFLWYSEKIVILLMSTNPLQIIFSFWNIL